VKDFFEEAHPEFYGLIRGKSKDKKKRKCLRCGHSFQSKNAGNRVCSYCVGKTNPRSNITW